MDTLAQFLVNGLALGGLYALLSLGFAVIYNTIRVFHVLHGAVFVGAGYVAYFFSRVLEWPLIIGVVFGIAAAVVMGILIELAVYRPLRRRSAGFLTAFLASLAGMFFMEGFLVAIAKTDLKVLKVGPLSVFQVGGVTITYYSVMTIALIIVLFAGVTVFFKRTQWGRMIRAVASNPELATAVGINSSQVYLMVFGLGSGLAGVAGIVRAYDIGLEPVVGLQLAIIAAVGVIIGGIGSMPGAAVGGLALGLTQTLAAIMFGGQWGQPVAFMMLLVIILFRPYGLLGTREHRELRRLL
jgi:branched-chain amino acid transport system permease protein